MSQRILRGLPASGGVAVARAHVVHEPDPPSASNGGGGEGEQRRALAALARVAAELSRLADGARAAGRVEEADILEANLLIAEDPVLHEQVRALAGEIGAESAVRDATAHHARLLAGLDDAHLAARAADVRQLGIRAARLLSGTPDLALPDHAVVLLAADLGPADVAALDVGRASLGGIALAEGAATSHVAIMARALGLPMAVGLGPELLEVEDGEHVVLDGENGVVIVAPTTALRRRALGAVERQERERRALAAGRDLPSVTRDGRAVALLCNGATAAEIQAGLEARAEGVGLLRTELAFLESDDWPTEDDHLAALEPALAPLAGRITTVRTLDFGADKTPPFLDGIDERGLALMLRHPDALAAQLRAVLRAGRATRLRLLLPLVEEATHVRAVRSLLADAVSATEWGGPHPLLGAMIETPAAVSRASEIAAEVDFLSIGTNDLVQYTLGLDRSLPLATALAAAEPAVLGHVHRVLTAARGRGIPVEVCGEAAGEPRVATLLVGLGVDELSVAPARLDGIRALVRGVSFGEAADVARRALSAGSADEALALAEALSGEVRDELGEARDGLGGILS